MRNLKAEIATARATNPARFKPGKPSAPLAAPYFNVWNCPIGRAQKAPQGTSTISAECAAIDLPF